MAVARARLPARGGRIILKPVKIGERDVGQAAFRGDSFDTYALAQADLSSLQQLCERCEDYYQMVTGSPPGPQEAQATLKGCPPGFERPEDKFVLGVVQVDEAEGPQLVGVLDCLRDYPAPGEWCLGLLMFDPGVRNRGLGQAVYGGFERWAQSMGAKSIRLGVVDQNPDARRFWERLGFDLLEKRSGIRYGSRDTTLWVMKRAVG